MENTKPTSKSYDFTLTINGKDYSNNLTSIRIVSNLQNCWPVFSLQLYVSQSGILLEKLHGQDDIKLKVRLLNYDGDETESITFDLMALQPKTDLKTNNQMIEVGDNQSEYVPLSLMLVPKLVYKSMTKITNGIYSNKKIKDVITDLCNKSEGLKIKFDTNGENTEIIDQICVYPTTLYKSLIQVDNNFGIYSGCPAIYCYYNNELQIINLSDRVKKAANIIIHHLASNKDNSEIIKKCKDGTNFYSYSEIKTDNKTNQEFTKLGSKINYIVKPKDKLFHVINVDLEEICKKFGAISGDDKIFMNQNTERVKYESSECGNGMSETFIQSKIAKQIFGLNSISVSLEKSLIIGKLLQVGSCVKFKTETVEYMDISGQYILQMSDLNWNREGKEWSNTCRLKLVRTNKAK
jgi:hypothetical protein